MSSEHHNLADPLTSFVGREAEIAEIERRLPQTRLLTLLGSGGVGKTRLATRIGLDLASQYRARSWLVSLAPLGDPTLVLRAAAATLGVLEEASRDLLETMIDVLRARGPLLLILDNCEHVLIGVSEIVERLLRGCPELTILATSRAALGVAGETIHRVPSLTLPESAASLSPGGNPLTDLLV